MVTGGRAAVAGPDIRSRASRDLRGAFGRFPRGVAQRNNVAAFGPLLLVVRRLLQPEPVDARGAETDIGRFGEARDSALGGSLARRNDGDAGDCAFFRQKTRAAAVS